MCAYSSNGSKRLNCMDFWKLSVAEQNEQWGVYDVLLHILCL